MSWVITGSEKNPVDLFRSNVSLLLHGDGTNGSTTIVDSSPTPKTVTAVGDAKISTAQSKFGGASVLFDGSGDYLTTPNIDSFNLSSGDLTIETWIRLNATNKTQGIFSSRGTEGGGVVFRVQSDNTLVFFITNQASTAALNPGVVSVNTWHHVAVTRSGNTFRLFLDGIAGSAVTSSATGTAGSALIAVGTENTVTATSPLDAYIDDLRITKGVARYTANFTPPTAPFPDI